MLGQVLKKYQSAKKTNQKTVQSLKQTIEQQIESITIQALKIQNHKVSKIHSNQQEIQNRLRKNSQLQAQLKVHLGGWVLLYDQLNKTLKEAGDVAHYARYVQEQINQINQQLTLRMQEDIRNASNPTSPQKKTEETIVNQTKKSEQKQQRKQPQQAMNQKEGNENDNENENENEKKEQINDQFFDVQV